MLATTRQKAIVPQLGNNNNNNKAKIVSVSSSSDNINSMNNRQISLPGNNGGGGTTKQQQQTASYAAPTAGMLPKLEKGGFRGSVGNVNIPALRLTNNNQRRASIDDNDVTDMQQQFSLPIGDIGSGGSGMLAGVPTTGAATRRGSPSTQASLIVNNNAANSIGIGGTTTSRSMAWPTNRSTTGGTTNGAPSITEPQPPPPISQAPPLPRRLQPPPPPQSQSRLLNNSNSQAAAAAALRRSQTWEGELSQQQPLATVATHRQSRAVPPPLRGQRNSLMGGNSGGGGGGGLIMMRPLREGQPLEDDAAVDDTIDPVEKARQEAELRQRIQCWLDHFPATIEEMDRPTTPLIIEEEPKPLEANFTVVHTEPGDSKAKATNSNSGTLTTVASLPTML